MFSQRKFKPPDAALGAPTLDSLKKEIAALRKFIDETFRSFDTPGVVFPVATYTPTITSSSGALTTVSATGRYTQIGNTYFFYVEITLTTNGTGATALKFTLPVNAGTAAVVSGVDITSAVALAGDIVAGNGFGAFTKYDGTYPGADGHTYKVAGSFTV